MAVAVRILGTGSFLPGEPVPPERMEAVLGPIAGLRPRVAARAERLSAEILSRSGVSQRHYAIDPATRRQTETHASMMEHAARAALAAAAVPADSVDLLICAAPLPDYACPPTSALVQGLLGIRSCLEIEVHSNCTGAVKGLAIALDMLRQGRCRRAIVAYAQISSCFLRAEYFHGPEVGLEHLALRWMMSDGSGAVVLDAAADPAAGPAVLEAFVESSGGDRAPGMIGGMLGAFQHEVPLGGRPTFHALHESGRHHVAQDLSAVARLAPRQLIEGVAGMLSTAGIAGDEVAHFLLGIPGRHFMTVEMLRLFTERVGTDSARLTLDVADFGYCGGATTFVQLDRLARSGRWARGEIVAAYLEESSKWMSGGFLARG